MARHNFSNRRSHTKGPQQGVKPAKKKISASRRSNQSALIITFRLKKLEIDKLITLLTSIIGLVTALVGLIALIAKLIAGASSDIPNMHIPSSTPVAAPSYRVSSIPTWTNRLTNTSFVTAASQVTYKATPPLTNTVIVTPAQSNLVTKSLPSGSTHKAYPYSTSTKVLVSTITLVPMQSSMGTGTIPVGATNMSFVTPTYTRIPTNTLPATSTPISIESLTPIPSPFSTRTPSNVPTSLGYTPTDIPTFTPTPIKTDHNLKVTHNNSYRGWKVEAIVDPSDAVIHYNPAQFGNWVKDDDVRVTVTAVWRDGTTGTKKIKLHQPEDCEDTLPISTQTGTPVDIPFPTPIQTVTALPSPTYTSTPNPPENEDGEGCSSSYWKNHFQSWQQAGYSPTDDFDTVFEVNVFNPDITLEQALNMRGGNDQRLARQGVAALLNAGYPTLRYPLTVAQVTDLVKVEDTDVLAEFNESVCPLKRINGC